MQTRFVMICSRDFWFRALGEDVRVWALIDAFSGEDITVFLINDDSAVIASRRFPTRAAARRMLRDEGYVRLLEDQAVQANIEVPDAPFHLDLRVPQAQDAPMSAIRSARYLARSA